MKKDEKWERLTEVPERLEGKRRLALEFLLKKSDGVAVCYAPKGRSKYRARFDDGAYQGEYIFTIHHGKLTPLSVYLMCANTGWPGFKLHWLEDLAEVEMVKEMEKAKEDEERMREWRAKQEQGKSIYPPSQNLNTHKNAVSPCPNTP